MPSGLWELVHDEDTGKAALIRLDLDDVGSETVFADELMIKGLFQSEEGEMWVQAGHSESRSYSLDFAMTKHDDTDFTIRVGVAAATAKLDMFIFQAPRRLSCRCFSQPPTSTSFSAF